MRQTQTDRLSAERAQLLDTARLGDDNALRRIAQIDRELAILRSRRLLQRARREILFDLNGHHGPA